MKPLLNVTHLNVTYKGGIEAVRDIQLEIGEGEIVGLLGESGSGKTACAQALMGLISPLHDVNITGTFMDRPFKPEAFRGKEMSLILQNPMAALNPTMTIGRQLVEGLCYHESVSQKQAYMKGLELLDAVGIDDPKRRYMNYPFQLSGGQKQRVVIAMALSTSPKLLIADEPTTALDPTIQLQILNLLRYLCRLKKMSLLLLTHDLGVCAHLCDRVAVMYQGKIVEVQRVKSLFSSPIHPYTQQMLLMGSPC